MKNKENVKTNEKSNKNEHNNDIETIKQNILKEIENYKNEVNIKLKIYQTACSQIKILENNEYFENSIKNIKEIVDFYEKDNIKLSQIESELLKEKNNNDNLYKMKEEEFLIHKNKFNDLNEKYNYLKIEVN